MAEGRSNPGIAGQLGISQRTVEATCAQLFRKLNLEPSPDLNRRVLAVLTLLTSREQDILALMAEGRSNSGIAGQLGISQRTVEAACAQLFRKLNLEPSPDLNRRVLAVLTLLRN